MVALVGCLKLQLCIDVNPGWLRLGVAPGAKSRPSYMTHFAGDPPAANAHTDVSPASPTHVIECSWVTLYCLFVARVTL